MPAPQSARLFFSILIGALSGIGHGSAAEHLAGPVAGVVEKVADGDTLTVRAKIWLGQEILFNVRLADIDAPELSRPGCAAERLLAAQAQNFVARRTAGKTIWLRDIHHGKYAGRVVATISTRDGDLGDALLRAGLARRYKDKHTRWCPVG